MGQDDQKDFNPVWYICKQCKNVFRNKSQLFEHKNLKHLDLMNNERKQSGQGNNSTNGESTNQVGEHSSQKSSETREASVIVVNGQARQNSDPGSSSSSSHRATSTITKNVDEAESSTDDEVEIIFESAKVGKKLEKIDDDEDKEDEDEEEEEDFQGSKESTSRKNKNVLNWSSFEEESNTPVPEIIAKLQVLGRHKYCSNCLKRFRKTKRFVAHRKICHLKVSSTYADLKSKYRLEIVPSRSPSSSSSTQDYIIVRDRSSSQSTNSNNNNTPKIKLTCESCQKKSQSSSKNLVHNIKSHEHERRSRKVKSVWTYGQGYNYYLYRHLRIHKKPSNLKCSQCSSSLMNTNRMKKQSVSKSKQLQKQQRSQSQFTFTESTICCKLCNQSFCSKTSLIMHLRAHTFPIDDSH